MVQAGNSKDYGVALQRLKELSRSLSEVHKALLNFQREIYEGLEHKRVNAMDVLTLAIVHPDFAWLRPTSSLILAIDEAIADHETDFESLETAVRSKLKEMFIDEGAHRDLKVRLSLVLDKNPSFCLELADLRKRLV